MHKNKKKAKKISKNTTKSRLKDTPFNSADELKAAKNKIRLEVWEQLEKTKIFYELLKKDEYSLLKDELERELQAGISLHNGSLDDVFFKAFSRGTGIEIEVNEEKVQKSPGSIPLIEAAIRAFSHSFTNTHYVLKGLMLDKQPDKNMAKKE